MQPPFFRNQQKLQTPNRIVIAEGNSNWNETKKKNCKNFSSFFRFWWSRRRRKKTIVFAYNLGEFRCCVYKLFFFSIQSSCVSTDFNWKSLCCWKSMGTPCWKDTAPMRDRMKRRKNWKTRTSTKWTNPEETNQKSQLQFGGTHRREK